MADVVSIHGTVSVPCSYRKKRVPHGGLTILHFPTYSWQMLFQSFCCNFSLNWNFVLKRTILYVHYVDLLMWSLTKLDFLFYDFSVIYYDFFQIFSENK
jgi:hypothetical protein